MKKFRYFVVKSDQHIVEPNTKLGGVDTNARAAELADRIASEPVLIEAVVDLGDLADTTVNPVRMEAVATPQTYQQAQSLLGSLPGKKLYLPGNHDSPSLLYQIMGDNWDSSEAGGYTYRFGTIDFIGIDLRTGPEPTGYLREETATRLQSILKDTDGAILFLHYPWFAVDNGRIDPDLSTTNGSRLQEIFSDHNQKILAIFHGHLHLWWSGIVGRIPVYCSAGSAFAFELTPGQGGLEKIVDQPRGYYLVGLGEDNSLIVRPRFV